MRPTNFATVGLIGIMGCVESTPDSTTVALVVQPANANVTVVDGQPTAQAYRALAVDSDGITRDVTAETTFVLTGGDAEWSGSLLVLDGKSVGPMRVMAIHGDIDAEASLTVRARTNVLVDAPTNAASLFVNAVTDPGCVPEVSYPADGVVMPPNLGELDVQWIDTRNDLFEVAVATTYVDTRIYTRALAWTKLPAASWAQLASQHEAMSLTVSGIVERVPQVRCNTATQRILLTDQPLTGNLYLANADGVQRANVAAPTNAAESILSAAMWDATFAPLVGGDADTCFGCALSRDGSRLAIASQTTGVLYDLANHSMTSPTAKGWSSAAFSANGEKLITASGGDIQVITRTGNPLTTITHQPGLDGLDPQMSPDGRWIANVEAIDMSAELQTPAPQSGAPSTATIEQTGQLAPFGSTIVVRQFFDGSNEVGSRTALVPLEGGVAAYFPAWSPDGRYIVFTRATGWGQVETTASLWIMRADGSELPIQLTAPSPYLDIRARFVPTMMSVGGDPLYMIAFESRQAFGEQQAAGRLQLWAMPFFPNRVCLGTLPSCTVSSRLPAMRLPMQSLAVDNRMLAWLE